MSRAMVAIAVIVSLAACAGAQKGGGAKGDPASANDRALSAKPTDPGYGPSGGGKNDCSKADGAW